MTEILALFRIVPDYNEVLPDDWKNIKHLDTEFVSNIYDAFDEGALEGALRVKDELKEKNEEVYCTAIGAGIYSDALLSALYAAGFDEVRFYKGENRDESTFASVVSEYIKDERPDVIFTGAESGSFGYRMDGPRVAAEFRIPWFMDVTEVRCAENGNFDITFETEKKYLTARQPAPFVCSFGNAVHPDLRMFSLKARMEASGKEIFTGKMPDDRKTAGKVSFEIPDNKQSCRFLEETQDETVDRLIKACERKAVE